MMYGSIFIICELTELRKDEAIQRPDLVLEL